MKTLMPFFLFALLGFAVLSPAADSNVIINELMYHPPNDRDELQWIEIFNRGTSVVDLSGWSFKKGVEFRFPAGTSVPQVGFVVIARDTNAFLTNYAPRFAGALLLGDFVGKLSHSGEAVVLANRAGQTVDTVKYSDRDGWARGADGSSASLERICPDASSSETANWAASKLPSAIRAAGSPGQTNDSFSPRLPPVVSAVNFPEIAVPGQPVSINALFANAATVSNVTLSWRTFNNNFRSEEQTMTMKRGASGVFEAALPGQASGTLTRFTVRAMDADGTTRIEPGENEPRSTFSIFHFANTNTATVPFAFLMRTAPPDKVAPRRGRPSVALQAARADAAFIFADTNGGAVRLFDHVRLLPRSGGWKIHFQHDRMFRDMRSLNVIFEAPRWVLSEALGHEVFRRAGVPAPATDYLRVWENGRLRGFHLAVEQVDKAFLAARGRKTDGDLFKLLWYGRGVVGQHEKKTNLDTGHADLLALLSALREKSGGAQWEIIQNNFNVDEVAAYFAVNQLIGNWDGFHNNHFIYKVAGAAGRWEIYPWDLDKTFGDFDGAPADYAWFDMPLSYGMEGDASPSAEKNNRLRQRGGFGGVSWWREGGYFSRPLLANAEFRARFLARVRTLCQTEFTEAKLFPWIDETEKRLEREIRVRTSAAGEDGTAALREFHANMESLRRFIRGRRAFLLDNLKTAK